MIIGVLKSCDGNRTFFFMIAGVFETGVWNRNLTMGEVEELLEDYLLT